MGTNELIVALATASIVIACVLLHTEALHLLKTISRDRMPARSGIAFSVLGLVVLHVIEIWIFAFGYFFLLRDRDLGTLMTTAESSLPDFVYYSATVYTTLGFGDIVPSGPIRFLTGVEAVMGLTLITWSASFMFLEMQRYWSRD